MKTINLLKTVFGIGGLSFFIFFLNSCNSSKSNDANTSEPISINSEKLVELRKDTSIQIIDVRTPGEVSDGYIPGTTMFFDINSDDFDAKIDKLDKSKKYIVYCKSGGIPGYRARIRPIVSRITIHWPSFYNVVTGKTLALPNLIALQHIPLSPAGVIAKRPAPIALPNSCAAEWRMAPDAVFSPYASVRYFTPHMVHSQYNLL
jgi:hypothetical protein